MIRFSRIAKSILPLFIIVTIGCSSSPQMDADLSQAVASVRYMTSERWLSRSAFQAAYPDRQPSDYVSYLFSDFGVAEWPIAIDEQERQQLRAAGIPPLPADLPLVPNRPDPTHERQVVIRADDTEGVVIIEAYETPNNQPIFSQVRKLNP